MKSPSPSIRRLRRQSIPIETTILATPGQIELHLSAAGRDVPAIDRALEEAVGRLADALGSVVFSVDGRPLEAVVGDLLRERGWRIAAAESCTAGLLLGRLTEIPGSSAWVIGGVVAYANDVKTRELGVPDAMLAAHGAVSEPVARAMADGVRASFGADIGVAITGIAGPDGGIRDQASRHGRHGRVWSRAGREDVHLSRRSPDGPGARGRGSARPGAPVGPRTVRLFLAVSPDAPARLRIDALRADVERAAGDAAPALRWVAAAVAHLTVHFLGEVDSGRLPALVASLESAVPCRGRST